jgi:tol-pal system protein YbgF
MLVAAAALLMGGCATKSDIRDLQTELRDELRALANRQDSLLEQLRSEALSTQDTLRTQSDQIFDFRGDITRELREISRGLATLQALAGENQRGIAGVRDQLANLRRLPTQGEAPMGAASNQGVQESVGGVGGNAEQLWDVATGQLGRGALNTAQRAFEQFLEEYPNHDRAPDAHFFLADILEQQDRPEDALEAFQQIQSLFPTAGKVPDAAYRAALLQIEMDDTDAAIETLERIINTYPESAIALIARDKLEEIR